MEYKIQGSVPYDGAQITTFSTSSNSQSGPVYEIGGSAEYALSFSEAGITGNGWIIDEMQSAFDNAGGETDPTAGFYGVVKWVDSYTGGISANEYILVNYILDQLGLAASSYRNCLFAEES